MTTFGLIRSSFDPVTLSVKWPYFTYKCFKDYVHSISKTLKIKAIRRHNRNERSYISGLERKASFMHEDEIAFILIQSELWLDIDSCASV